MVVSGWVIYGDVDVVEMGGRIEGSDVVVDWGCYCDVCRDGVGRW